MKIHKKEKNFKLQDLKKLVNYSKRYLLWYAFLSIISIFISLFGILWNEVFRIIINGAVSYQKSMVINGFYFACIVFIIDTFLQLINNIYSEKLDNISVKHMQEKISNQLLKSRLSNFNKENSSDYTFIINDLIPSFQITINSKVRDFFSILFMVISTLIYLSVLDLGLTIGVAVCCIILPFLSNFVSPYLKKIYLEIRQLLFHLYSLIQDTVKGNVEIKIFSIKDSFIMKINSKYDEYLKKNIKALFVEEIISQMNSGANYISILFILGYGGMMVLEGKSELGDIAIFLYSSLRIINPITCIMSMWTQIQKAMTQMEKFDEVMNYKQEEKNEEKSNKLSKINSPKIIFHNVFFSYSNDEDILENVNFEIKPNKITALVGKNGSGKSTIVRLLLRLYNPDRGSILVSGKDLESFSMKEWRNNIAYVPQDQFLFHDSIFENIKYGDLNASKEDIVAAAKLAEIHQYIIGTKEGYNTIVLEGGINISSGERQRILLARSFLRNPKLMILDEPTSVLDYKNETKIIANLYNFMKERTTLIIAHQLSTIKKADYIIYIEHGIIKESGSFKQLMDKKGDFYRNMYSIINQNVKGD